MDRLVLQSAAIRVTPAAALAVWQARIAGRERVNRPVARMWHSGIITLSEMQLTQLVEEQFPDAVWQALVTATRIKKAGVLRQERMRRRGAEQAGTVVDVPAQQESADRSLIPSKASE